MSRKKGKGRTKLPKGERFLYFEKRNLIFWKKWKKYYSGFDQAKKELKLYKDETKKKVLKTIKIKPGTVFYDAVYKKDKACCIELDIPKKKKDKFDKFFVFTERTQDIDELKLELEASGSKFLGQAKFKHGAFSKLFGRKIGHALLKLEEREVEKWTREDVFTWLELLGQEKDVIKKFEQNDIEGSTLLELDESTIVNGLGLNNQTARILYGEIRRLNETKRFDMNRVVVKQKMTKFPGFDETNPEYKKLIDCLCDVSKLKFQFLTTADLQSHTLSGLDSEEEILENFDEAKVHVKLVVTEVSQTGTMAKLMNPVVSAIIPKLKNQLNQFKTAVIIGPWYLEWTDSELIVPKRMVCGKAIISADVDTLLLTKNELPILTDKLADVVVRYNTQYYYKSELSTKKNQMNCQDFIDDVFKELGISNVFHGALEDFIQRLKDSGKAILEFRASNEFKEKFGMKEKSIVFTTHKDLDNFCLGLKKVDIEVHSNYASEWSLLKSFDRAFWLRHLKMLDEEDYKPLPPLPEYSFKKFATQCPFKDPRETMSYK